VKRAGRPLEVSMADNSTTDVKVADQVGRLCNIITLGLFSVAVTISLAGLGIALAIKSLHP
jgi:hypothetical protein